MSPVDDLRDEQQTCSLLRVSLPTLRRWRGLRIGPAWITIGRRIFYRDADLSAWIESQRTEPARERASA